MTFKKLEPATEYQLSFAKSMMSKWVQENRAVALKIKEDALRAATPTLSRTSTAYLELYWAVLDEIASEQVSKMIKRKILSMNDLTSFEASQVIKTLKAANYHRWDCRLRKGLNEIA